MSCHWTIPHHFSSGRYFITHIRPTQVKRGTNYELFGIGRVPILGRMIVGEEGGGIFAIRYDYTKIGDKDGNFSINPVSAVIPGAIRNIFDLI